MPNEKEPDLTLNHGCSEGEAHLETYLMQQGPGPSVDLPYYERCHAHRET